jgi:hypothetical protein
MSESLVTRLPGTDEYRSATERLVTYAEERDKQGRVTRRSLSFVVVRIEEEKEGACDTK